MKGAFGQVHVATFHTKPIAIKMIDKKLIKDARMNKRVSNEVEVHWQLNHPSILQLYTYFEDKEKVYLVTELCENGELFQYLQNTPRCRFGEDEARWVMREVILGLSYLHSHSIVHRDLKLSNLLLTKEYKIVTTPSLHTTHNSNLTFYILLCHKILSLYHPSLENCGFWSRCENRRTSRTKNYVWNPELCLILNAF